MMHEKLIGCQVILLVMRGCPTVAFLIVYIIGHSYSGASRVMLTVGMKKVFLSYQMSCVCLCHKGSSVRDVALTDVDRLF